jgi:DNA recombination protein RmuC
MEFILGALIGVAVGAALGHFRIQGKHAVAQSRCEELSRQLSEHQNLRGQADQELRELRETVATLNTTLEHEREASTARSADDERMVAQFEKLAKTTLAETRAQLEKSAEGTLKLANEQAKSEFTQQKVGIEHLVKPMQENLARLEKHIQETERARKEEYGGLFQQMQEVAATNTKVQREAADLKSVLRSSSATRGRWGEVQLRRVVELAGMSEHCDFSEQTHAASDDGNARADLIVHLPGDIKIAVDAKVPYDAYEQAQTADDSAMQTKFMADHARRFRAHVDALAKREYPEKYTPSSGFTIMFVPGESLLDAALNSDTRLWEHAAEKKVLLATPTTLIALLRMTALGWRQQAQAENAVEITEVGRELYKRLAGAGEHMEKVGKGLSQAVNSYNKYVGSMESRVMPSARRLSNLGAGNDAMSTPEQLTTSTRAVNSDVFPVLVDTDDDDIRELAEHNKRRTG